MSGKLPGDDKTREEARAGVSADLLQQVLDYAPIGIWLQNAEGRLLFVNRTYCEAVGISEERFLAVPHYAELYDEATARSCLASDAVALAQPGPHTSWEKVPFVDGRLHDIEIVKVKLAGADGRPGGIVGLSTDVTERLRAEAELRESRSRLAGIIDSAMDAVITLDEEQRVLVFNAAAEQIFGCPAAEAIGQPVHRFIPERFREAHREHVRAFAATGQTTRTMGRLGRLAALRADGEEFPCEASISRVEVNGRRLVTVIMRDVGERERAAAAQRVLEAKIRQAQKMEALGTLAGGIAHDFNNLLSVVLLNAELATRDRALGAGARDCIDNIVQAGERARELVQRILAFSRRQPQVRSVIDLRPALEEAVRFLRSTLPAGVELAVALDPATPPVVADATEIHQIAVNLCTNAWHAIEGKGKGGRIELRLEAASVGEAAANEDLRPGAYALLTVADDGQGMDPATLERIFDPFFTTKAVGRGTGLGLSLVHGIAKELHGAVTVESRPGEGTTFRLYLPVADPRERAAEPPAARAQGPQGDFERVLLVDDEEQILRVVTQLLERAGFRVSGHSRPVEALAAVRAGSERFDVAVADVNMPGLSGLAFARELARLRPGLPIVLTSGNVTLELEEEAARAGVRRVLQKPYATSELREVIRSLARRDGPQREPAPPSPQPAALKVSR